MLNNNKIKTNNKINLLSLLFVFFVAFSCAFIPYYLEYRKYKDDNTTQNNSQNRALKFAGTFVLYLLVVVIYTKL